MEVGELVKAVNVTLGVALGVEVGGWRLESE